MAEVWNLNRKLAKARFSESSCRRIRQRNNVMARIAIIEDDLEVAASLRHLLETEGHEVETPASPEAGLVEAGEGKFDVVVTDLQMPGQNGLEVIKKLHAARPQLPVILMTAHHTTEAAIEATKFGAYDYILKPID